MRNIGCTHKIGEVLGEVFCENDWKCLETDCNELQSVLTNNAENINV